MPNALSQFFILSPRGDSIIFRDLRRDCPKNTTESFYRNVKFWGGKVAEAPPVFNLDHLNYMYLKKNGLYFVFISRDNVSPNFATELLIRLTKVMKDYCGVLSEESVRTNFVLLYELIDEILDYGYVQGTSTEQLKAYVFTDPIVVAAPAKSKSDSKTTPSTAVDKPITMKQKKGEKKNEIFVDIYERLNITFNANGYVLNSSIDGTIQMKSYLAGNPELKLALNEDLVIGKSAAGGGGVEIDDCNFHECAKLQDWDSQRILSFLPPDGEFTLMNYRVTSEFRAPFRIFPFFELVNSYSQCTAADPHPTHRRRASPPSQPLTVSSPLLSRCAEVELIIKVRADIPENAKGTSVVVSVPVPKGCSGATCNLVPGVVGQVWEYDAAARVILWKIKTFPGGREESIKCNIALGSSHTASVRKEIGPINLAFEIPMYNPSGLQVRYLRISSADVGYSPYRWVRFVTRSQSYVCRL